MRRDRSRCQYCGQRDRLTIDHVLPRSRGGRDTWENLDGAGTNFAAISVPLQGNGGGGGTSIAPPTNGNAIWTTALNVK